MAEWLKAHAWKACIPQGIQGSNPCLSAISRPRFRIRSKRAAAVTQDTNTISQRTRFQVAMILAIAADALQLIALPLFVEGAESPADDILDLGIGVAMFALLGWHWEFLPSFFAKLVPGVDLAPLWTLSVANVYRKSKRTLVTPTDEDRTRP
jgi:hypothetical protein